MTFPTRKSTVFGAQTRLMLSIGFSVVLFLAGSVSAVPTLRTTWPASADAFVRSGFSSAKKNFGREPILELQTNNRNLSSETYLRFDLSTVDPNVKEARLRLNISAEKDEPTTVVIRSAAGNWDENAINWKEKPEQGQAIAQIQAVGTAAAWYEADLSNFIKAEVAAGNRTISLALSVADGSNNKLTIQSREAASNGPELVTARPVFTAKVIFQPKGKAVPAGYMADSGERFGSRGNTGLTFGWSADIAQFVQDRNAPGLDDPKPAKGPDARYLGVAMMDNPEMKEPANWEIAVPNGKYKVHVVAGDACYFDSIYAVSVEGVLTVDGIPEQNKRWIEGAKIVEVKDGKLTVSNNSKGINNKLCFLEIAESP